MNKSILEKGQQTTSLILNSRNKYNDTKILVEKDSIYKITILEIKENFKDWSYKVDTFDGFDPFIINWIFKPRLKSEKYFCLCGSIGKGEKLMFKIGTQLEFVAPESGDLYLFLNDYHLQAAYNNNKGIASYCIERI